MESETDRMELMQPMDPREPRELMELLELMDEVLDVHVEHEVAWLEVDPTLLQGQG